MFDTSVDVAYVGAKGSGGYAALDINAPQTLGVGDAGRPYAPQGRLLAINSWGQRLKTDYQSLQVALNKPFTHGLLFKGAYTLSKSMNQTDNDGRATLTWNTPSELWRWFDTTAFAQPTGVRFGNTGRNQFYGPGGWNLDFSLFRSFLVGGTRRLEYRLQAANLLNHPVFGNPSSSVTSGTFGQITGITGSGSYLERQIQMGLRFSF